MGLKQRHLNGAYYKPPNPSPTETNRSDDTPETSGWREFIIILILIGLLFSPVLWVIIRPDGAEFYVTDAILNRFSNDRDSYNLHYSLDLNFTIRNTNRLVGIYYDEFSVDGYYGGQLFGSGNVSSFYQGRKNTTVIGTRIEGQNFVVLDQGARTDLKEDKVYGIYRIDVKVRLSMKFNYWLMKSGKLEPKITCEDLKIPLASSYSARGFKFRPVQCSFRFSDDLFSLPY